MSHIKNRAKLIIFAVTLFVGILSTISMLLILRDQAEKSMANIAEQETWRIHSQLIDVLENKTKTNQTNDAKKVIGQMIGGIFEWVELYSASGVKIVNVSTEKGRHLEPAISPHKNLERSKPVTFVDENSSTSVLRIIVPIHKTKGATNGEILGYLEVGREVPEWRKKQVRDVTLFISLVTALSALLSGLLVYPSILVLLRKQRESAQKLLDSHIQVLESLGLAVAKRESGTGTHNYKVTWIAARLGEEMGLAGTEIKKLIAGSFLHDVGKIAIPDHILLKPGKLTDDEMIIMKEHVAHGEDIVKNLGWFSDSLSVVSSHHEKWDGTGYPRQLSGTEIPIEARIFAVADVFDALCSKRPYKDSIEFSEAMDYIKTQSGKHFDPSVVSVFDGMARSMYEQTRDITELDAKALIEPLISKYFSVDLLD